MSAEIRHRPRCMFCGETLPWSFVQRAHALERWEASLRDIERRSIGFVFFGALLCVLSGLLLPVLR